MTIVSPTACTYEIGEEWRIVALDSAWSAFAYANEAPHLAAPAPIGRSIFDYISDPTTALLYRRVFDRVFETRESVTLPLRCDSPTARRWLEIDIRPRRLFGLTLHSRVVREEARPEVRLLAAGMTRSDDLVRMCSWCKRVAADDRWCEAEEAIALMRVFEKEEMPDITHGMCPHCYEQMSALLDR